jgi:hypothetical protein
MIDDQLVLKVERLRDSIENFRSDLRAKYRQPARQVVSESVRRESAQLAEMWLVDIALVPGLSAALGEETLGDLNIQFQRLLTYSEQAVIRRKYDGVIKALLADFRARVVIPLKRARGAPSRVPPVEPHTPSAMQSVFVGQSFAKEDEEVNSLVRRFLAALGYDVVTGEKPSADSVSAKVRRRIEQCDGFVGIFTRREKIARRAEWLTSPWIVDEKAFALAKSKKLVLLREVGVQSIGGLQGDYEYLPFERQNMGDLLVRLLETLHE